MLDGLRDRGIKFRSLTEAIDTTTPTGRAMWQMVGVLAGLEHSLISERTRAGVKAAKRRGGEIWTQTEVDPAANRPRAEVERPRRGNAGRDRIYKRWTNDPLPGTCRRLSESVTYIKGCLIERCF